MLRGPLVPPEPVDPYIHRCAQSIGNFAASAIGGLLWTLISPVAAFLWFAAWMLLALVAFALGRHGQLAM